MTKRKLPEIEAFFPKDMELEPSPDAAAKFHPVNAKTGSDPDRTLAIMGEIGDRYEGVTEAYVRGALRRMGRGPVTVQLNSKGGDYFTGIAIYNMLREHDGEITTNVLGLAASAGSVIAMGSDKIRVPKAGFMMIHNASGIAMGNRHDFADMADTLGRFDAVMNGIYQDRTGIAADKIGAMMDKDTFINGEEAVELGFADEVLPADQVEDADEAPAEAAYRELDNFAAKHGMPRGERRALLSAVIAGTPRATGTVTPRADFAQPIAALQRLTRNLQT